MNDMQPDRHQPADADLDAPPKFVEALRRTQNRTVLVPSSVDAALRTAARAQLREAAPRRIVWLDFARWAAAACLVLSVLFVLWPSHPGKHLVRAPEDFNHDGTVDILDAFALARELGRGAKPDRTADLNHDGIVDRRDVDAIANKAVKLAKGGRS